MLFWLDPDQNQSAAKLANLFTSYARRQIVTWQLHCWNVIDSL